MKKKEPVLSPIQLPQPTKEHRAGKIKMAISLLNDVVKIKLAPSEIHGIGVFAMRNMKKGETLNADAIPHAFDVPYSEFKKLRPEVAEQILSHWPLVTKGSHFLYPVTKMTAFMNHSDKFNYDSKEDKLIRAVKKGEEITENYREIDGFEEVFPWLQTEPQKSSQLKSKKVK
jgi:hypothetical protein